MENSSKYFENTACAYYPCHKGVKAFNCLFCYCPFYNWKKCPGVNEYIEKEDGRRIKVCTKCTFPHQAENYDKVIKLLKNGEDKFSKEKTEGKGVLFGIGVGPGNPLLLTSEAREAIEKSEVLILPSKDRESCRAYQIAVKAMPEIDKKECRFVPFPMSMKEPYLSDFHKEVAEEISKLLEKGLNVGFLTIGDVSVYSTFIYIDSLVKEAGFETKYVAGISSFSAAAARLGVPLTIGKEKLHIIPGSGDVKEALKLDGTIVFMKSGKSLLDLRNLLIENEEELSLEVKAVSNCGMETEIVSIGAKAITEEMGYLTVVIVRKNK